MRRPKNTTLRKRSSMDERAGVKVKHRALELREKCDMSSGWGVEECSRQHVRVLQTGRRHLIGAGPCGVGGDRCMRCRGVHGDPYLSHRAWAKHLESSATPSAITTHLVPFTLTYQPHREDTMSSHVENLTPAFAPFFGMVSAGPLA
jgi:hypothetical protein